MKSPFYPNQKQHMYIQSSRGAKSVEISKNNLCLIRSQVDALSLKEANARNYCCEIIVKGWSNVKKILTGYTGHWITFVLWIISISLDPFVCYVPSIQDEEKLLKINSSLLIGIWVLYWSLLIYRISISFYGNIRKWQIFNQAESIALLFSNVLLYSLVLIPKMEISAPIFSVVLSIFLIVWGIQNISGFGQNLQVSTYAWENIFVILIAIYGVGTFTFFIGNMQNLIKSAIDERAEEKRKNEHQAIKLKKHQAIKLRQQQLQQWDVENNIKRELCLEPIKKVERFQRLSDTSLLHLCDCVKPVVYAERTRIVHEGDPINEMLFVLHGKLWNFSSMASSTNNVPPCDRRKEFLKDGDFWGEELVNWVQDESSSSSNKLISQTTIQALTKVEAFVLRIDDLKNLYNEKSKILQSWLHKRRIRISGRNAQPSNQEQTPPTGDQLTGPEVVV
ncbi:hypothetical protein Q3G72_026660 [Acer saccharum]|nr:hypothetical protein Q3G72_026660 [Acer saccharum]